MRKAISILMLTVLIFSSCQQKQKVKISNKIDSENLIDTSKIVIFPYDTSKYKGQTGYKQTELTAKDLKTIDSILSYCVERNNRNGLIEFKSFKRNQPEQNPEINDFLIDLKKYKRQYIPYLNTKGEREVLIRCLYPTKNFNWKKEELILKDSQKKYFVVLINLKTGEFADDIRHYLDRK